MRRTTLSLRPQIAYKKMICDFICDTNNLWYEQSVIRTICDTNRRWYEQPVIRIICDTTNIWYEVTTYECVVSAMCTTNTMNIKMMHYDVWQFVFYLLGWCRLWILVYLSINHLCNYIVYVSGYYDKKMAEKEDNNLFVLLSFGV